MALVGRAAVVGVGLIGGSFGMAFRRAGVASRVVALDRDGAVARRAVQRGAADEAGEMASLADADLAVLAVPVAEIVAVGREVQRMLPDGAVLTDVGSVKRPVVAALDGPRFVGGHPMAGTEASGIDAADPAMLLGRSFILTPTERTDPDAVDLVERAVGLCGMRAIRMDAASHDRLVAAVSHLPYLVAAAAVRGAPEEAIPAAGPTFLEMLRVARSDVVMWEQIASLNRDEILAALDRFERELARIRLAVAEGGIEGVLAEARAKAYRM